MMHVLEFLKSAEDEGRINEESVSVEFRLVCSGTLYPANFGGDWSKSNVARILLQRPVELLVASRPYDDYPQELVLRFVTSFVTESEGKVSHRFLPDQEIASDLAALLSLLCRRLITVSAKVRERYHESKAPPIVADFPIPVVTTAKMSFWTPRPTQFLYSLQGVQVRSYHPHPQPFNSSEIIETFLALPQLTVAPAVVRAARLYALAMNLIESQPDISYQLFVAVAETMAGAVLENWEPDDEDKIASKSNIVSYAMAQEGLSKDVADRLALETCRNNPWSAKKFTKFLLEHLDREAIKGEDDLFIVPEFFHPQEADIEKSLREVYRNRSGATHGGHSYPASAAIGPSPLFPPKSIDDVFNQKRPFPPVGWFERVLNNAVCGYLRSQVKQLKSGESNESSAVNWRSGNLFETDCRDREDIWWL